MDNSQTKLKYSLYNGARKGLRSFVWICKIIIPTSFLVALIQWSGLLYRVDFLLNPLMVLINLPGEAALPLISGMIINLYAVIAIIAVMPFTIPQMTLIAVFSLIAHNLIVEGIIQHKSGIGITRITLVRITAAIVAVLIVSQFFDDTTKSISIPVNLLVSTTLVEALKLWAIDIIGLCIKIFVIIMIIMIILESSSSLGWMKYILKFFTPFMRILGLSNRTTMPWVTAVIFGLMYGGVTIIEEFKRGVLTKEEFERLHISIGINHSIIEDPTLFLVLGLNGFWLWVPKLIIAVIAVQTYCAIKYLMKSPLHY